MGKSIEEILEKLQNENNLRKQSELEKEKELSEIAEKQRQEHLERMRMFESLALQSANSQSSNGGGGRVKTENYISQTDTIWLYPESDLAAYESTFIYSGGVYQTAPGVSPSIQFTKVRNAYSFPDVNQLANFFANVYLQTETSQPLGNKGFSCGVGTRTTSASNLRLILKLDSGIKVVEWALMTQINSQSELPVGGNSPLGTIGWGNIYCDWNLDGIQDPTSASAAAISNLIDGLVFKKL